MKPKKIVIMDDCKIHYISDCKAQMTLINIRGKVLQDDMSWMMAFNSWGYRVYFPKSDAGIYNKPPRLGKYRFVQKGNAVYLEWPSGDLDEELKLNLTPIAKSIIKECAPEGAVVWEEENNG